MSFGRCISTHRVRAICSLDGPWMLHLPDAGTTIEPGDWATGRAVEYDVPGCWERLWGLENYRGQAVARRAIIVDRSGPARLVFRGVSHTARVFVDGVEVGGHHNAFTPFAIDLPQLDAGEHELLVHISNEHGEVSALHVPNDYYNYGGISRPVELQQLNSSAYIRYVHMTPRQKDGRWMAHVSAGIDNLGDTVEATLHVDLAGQTCRLTRDFDAGHSVVEFEMDFDNVQPWSPQTPVLYGLEARLVHDGQVVDDWLDRTGFRIVRTQGQQLLLNDQPIFIMGFNRHEDHAEYGCALPLHAIRRDVDIMQDLGANAVRTSHYPNDERMLDLCDERGLMVWEENHARGLGTEKMQHPRFRDQCRACIDEMIEWHFNHPSIVLWGILNECESATEEGRAHYTEQFEQVKSLDRSRPTTYASCRYHNDICQDLPDVCGWNLYPTWYEQKTADEGVRELLDWLATTPAKDRPILYSEFGGGAIPGYHDPRRRGKWSEDRQADILDEQLAVALSHERLCGAFIWQFCDVRVDEKCAVNRPRTMNNKGVVDEYRRPKLAYEIVKRRFLACGRAGAVAT